MHLGIVNLIATHFKLSDKQVLDNLFWLMILTLHYIKLIDLQDLTRFSVEREHNLFGYCDFERGLRTYLH